jgi:hypothetical protein
MVEISEYPQDETIEGNILEIERRRLNSAKSALPF